MNIFEKFETIIYLTEVLLEDYEAYKDQQEEKGTKQAYSDLATVNNSIRRNKTKNLKNAVKELNKANKEELALRNSKNLYAHLQSLDKSEKAIKNAGKAREEEKEAYEEVNKARERAEKAQED